MTSLYKDEGPVPMRKARILHRMLALDSELEGVDLRVFLYLSSKLDHRKPVLVPQTEIAELMGKKTAHISRAVRRLKDKGILIAGEKVGRSATWRLNPDYGKR